MRLVRDAEIQDKISSQLDEYKKSIGDFGMSLAIHQREKLNPGIIEKVLSNFVYLSFILVT
jgi:hypothetical protein